jgi:hypothetical protein
MIEFPRLCEVRHRRWVNPFVLDHIGVPNETAVAVPTDVFRKSRRVLVICEPVTGLMECMDSSG